MCHNMILKHCKQIYPRVRGVLLKSHYAKPFTVKVGSEGNNEEITDFRFTKHIYKQLYPWKSLKEFAKCLTDSIVYNEGGIIAINKPYGIAQRSMNTYVTDPQHVVSTLNVSSAENAPYTIAEAIPLMKEILQVADLDVVKATERYTSGITFLASSEIAKKAIVNGLNRTKLRHVKPYTYLAVGVGPFVKDAEEQTVGISLLMLDEKTREQQPVIEDTFSKTRVDKGIVRPVSVCYQTLSKSPQMPSVLFEISTTKTKWHFLRVYPAHKGVAILGDNVYGSRVKWVFGKPVTISLFNSATRDLPTLPSSILRALEISQNKAVHIPTHLHLQRVTLACKKQQVIISAPPPRHFMYSCEKLSLALPCEVLKTCTIQDSCRSSVAI